MKINKIEIPTKRVRIIEPKKWLGFNVGWKISQDKLDLESGIDNFSHFMKGLDYSVKSFVLDAVRQSIADYYGECSQAFLTRGVIQHVIGPDFDAIEELIMSNKEKYTVGFKK